MLMIDIDYFKHINDTLGHQVGDGVLLEIALQIKTGLRDTDVIMRYGGEEFVVLLPHTDVHAAQQLAERLRQNIQQGMPVYGVPATVSIGIAQFHTGENQHQWLKRADSALYLAKEHGRNRCVACSG
jgi:diguanylate cyclase